ncbi:hypothetical protein LXL04_004513 [Taraxacum kok-saghyz]
MLQSLYQTMQMSTAFKDHQWSVARRCVLTGWGRFSSTEVKPTRAEHNEAHEDICFFDVSWVTHGYENHDQRGYQDREVMLREGEKSRSYGADIMLEAPVKDNQKNRIDRDHGWWRPCCVVKKSAKPMGRDHGYFAGLTDISSDFGHRQNLQNNSYTPTKRYPAQTERLNH